MINQEHFKSIKKEAWHLTYTVLYLTFADTNICDSSKTTTADLIEMNYCF